MYIILLYTRTALECSTRNITALTLPVGWSYLNYRLPLCLAITDLIGAESYSFAYSLVVCTLSRWQLQYILESLLNLANGQIPKIGFYML